MKNDERHASAIADSLDPCWLLVDTRAPISPNWLPKIYGEIERIVSRVISLDAKVDASAATMAVNGLRMLQHRTTAGTTGSATQRALIASGSRGSHVLSCRGDILIEDLNRPATRDLGITDPPAFGLWIWTGSYVVSGSGKTAWDGGYVGEYRRPTPAELHVIQNGGDPL